MKPDEEKLAHEGFKLYPSQLGKLKLRYGTQNKSLALRRAIDEVLGSAQPARSVNSPTRALSISHYATHDFGDEIFQSERLSIVTDNLFQFMGTEGHHLALIRRFRLALRTRIFLPTMDGDIDADTSAALNRLLESFVDSIGEYISHKTDHRKHSAANFRIIALDLDGAGFPSFQFITERRSVTALPVLNPPGLTAIICSDEIFPDAYEAQRAALRLRDELAHTDFIKDWLSKNGVLGPYKPKPTWLKGNK